MYLARITPAHLFIQTASSFDSYVRNAFKNIVKQFDIDTNPMAKSLLHVPVSQGGMGLSLMSRTHHAAYWMASANATNETNTILTNVNNNATTFKARSSCADFFLNNNINPVLNRNTAEEWNVFPQLQQLTQRSFHRHYHRVSTKGLQSSVTRPLHAIERDMDPASINQFKKLLSSSLLSNSNALLHHNTPSATEVIAPVSDDAFKNYMAMRLGLNPITLNLDPCVCRYAAKGTTDAWHGMTCPQFKRTIITDRHNAIVQLLAQFAKDAGCLVDVEADTGGLRPDMDIATADTWYTIDVSYVHTYADSCPKNANAALNKRFRDKKAKYAAQALANNQTFLPFILATNGGLHTECQKVIDLISREAIGNGRKVDKKKLLMNIAQVSANYTTQVLKKSARMRSFALNAHF